MHVRQQIRDFVAQSLIGISATTVNKSRTGFYSETQLPAVNVLSDDESLSDLRYVGGCQQARIELNVVIEIYVMLCDGYEDRLDDICAEIQQRIAGVPKLGGLAAFIEYQGSTVARNREHEQPFVTRALSYRCLYAVDLNQPDTALAA